MTEPGPPDRRVRRIAAVAGLWLLALVLLVVAVALMVTSYEVNATRGGATGLRFLVLAVLGLASGYLAAWVGSRLAGRPRWLAGRGTFTLVLVLVVSLVAPTASVLAGTWRYDAEVARADDACSGEDLDLLDGIDPASAISQAPLGASDGTCGKVVWVSGDGQALLTTFDLELTGKGWQRAGGPDLAAPVTYRKDGRELVVDVARGADGKPVAQAPAQGTEGSVYLR